MMGSMLLDVSPTDKAVEINGFRLQVGTSFYIHDNDRVAWIQEISENKVVLQALDTTIKIELDALARHITQDNIVIESQPPI